MSSVMRRSFLKAGGLAVSTLAAPTAHAAREPLDLTTPEDNLTALMKMRGDLSGREVTWWGSGSIYSYVPGEATRHLFKFEMFSVSRFEPYERGHHLLHREMGLFRDPKTGAILERWHNPFLQREVEVLHRFNDPVNVRFSSAPGPFGPPFTFIEHGDDIWFPFDIFFLRPSPISREEFPLNVQSDMYQGAELYMCHVKRGDLEDPETTSAPATIGWARIGQWEPFMEMGNRPGHLVFRLAAKKLMNGNADLPEEIHAYARERHPKFLSSPAKYTEPNESQWTAFKKLAAKRKQAAP